MSRSTDVINLYTVAQPYGYYCTQDYGPRPAVFPACFGIPLYRVEAKDDFFRAAACGREGFPSRAIGRVRPHGSYRRQAYDSINRGRVPGGHGTTVWSRPKRLPRRIGRSPCVPSVLSDYGVSEERLDLY